jgi:hypothetical protein
MIPGSKVQSTEQSGIRGGKRPFDPNIILIKLKNKKEGTIFIVPWLLQQHGNNFPPPLSLSIT